MEQKRSASGIQMTTGKRNNIIMNILVIDAQGGGIGKQIVSALKKRYPEQYITAVGTNSLATSAMLKAGADVAATGENPVIVCNCHRGRAPGRDHGSYGNSRGPESGQAYSGSGEPLR